MPEAWESEGKRAIKVFCLCETREKNAAREREQDAYLNLARW
jgi:hypothetical protein